jgi:hypothetical protein
MSAVRCLLLAIVVLASPATAGARGFEAHEFIDIIGAWQQAGRPAVPVEPQRTPRRIRRPNP